MSSERPKFRFINRINKKVNTTLSAAGVGVGLVGGILTPGFTEMSVKGLLIEYTFLVTLVVSSLSFYSNEPKPTTPPHNIPQNPIDIPGQIH